MMKCPFMFSSPLLNGDFFHIGGVDHVTWQNTARCVGFKWSQQCAIKIQESAGFHFIFFFFRLLRYSFIKLHLIASVSTEVFIFLPWSLLWINK